MKIVKLFLLGLIVVFAACREDEEPQPTAAGLLGRWSMTALEYEGSSTTRVSGIDVASNFTGVGKALDLIVTFRENPNTVSSEGSYVIALTTTTAGQSFTQDFTFDNFVGDGSWSLNNRVLTVTGTLGSQDATIVSQTSTTLVIAVETEQTQNAGGNSVRTRVEAVYTLTKI
ncbi:MAG: lipocalin family protein [Cyclobacteriaceae bacterium]|jgi:hypothetical protein|nr:lipocalin family protein [Cyclobacteriaceae bacterium]